MLNMENFTDIWIQIDLPLQYKQGDAYDLFSCYGMYEVICKICVAAWYWLWV